MTEQYLIDIAFNGQMAELNLLPPNNHSTFIQKILKLKTRKLLAKMAGIPGVLAAKMSEPYDTPLHPRTDWPLIVQLIGRYASWYCKQQQNQNEGAPTTREQRIAQMDAERQAKKKEYQRFIEEYWKCDSKILDKMRAIEDEIKRIKCGAELFVLQVEIMGMPPTEDTYVALNCEDCDGFENSNKPAPPKGSIWNEIINLRRCLRNLWNGLGRGEIDSTAAGQIPRFNFRGLTNKKEDEYGSWFPYFHETLDTQLTRMSLRFNKADDEPFDQLAAYIRVEITSIVKALACDRSLYWIST